LRPSEIISRLDLQPHPEGGYYRETYRSNGEILDLPPYFEGSRNYSTAIYFLLTGDNFSAFHRIRQDEMWHFYLGSPIELIEISSEGKVTTTHIGNDLEKEQQLQHLVPGGSWFASRLLPGAGDYALAGCTVSPGFDFRDFEMAKRADLIQLFPDHGELITVLTRE
jgi:predicted cupin superfamily sugar epimerase